MVDEDASNRVLESISLLREQLESLNKQLEREFDRNKTSEDLLKSVQNLANNNKEDISDVQERLRKLENAIAENRGKDSRRDPKLQKLPNRSQIDEMFNSRVTYKTFYMVGSLIAFFFSMLGTSFVIIATLYAGLL
jgi:tetrahydromethanopterin S-methyltransferase subunit B